MPLTRKVLRGRLRDIAGDVSALSSSERIQFGDFDADVRSGELRKHGIRVKLQVQPFQVLQILLERHGEVVTREELQKRIWPADTFVDFDQGLNTAVKKLREALGDDAEKPRFIETLSKRGYRFIGSIGNGVPATTNGVTGPASTGTYLPETHRKGFAWGLALAAAVVAALILAVGFNTAGMRDRVLGKAPALRIGSLAVLPLQNLSGDPNQEYFSDGMTDALITDLAQISSLKVISRTSSMQYKQTKKSLPEIARELNVEGIVEGTVQRSGHRVRITAQLIHGPSDKHIWASSYERELRDVFALERDVTSDIADQIQARLAIPKPGGRTEPRLVDPQVLEAYIQGSYHLNGIGRGGGDEEAKKAQAYFQRAIDLDPNFAPAYSGLAESHSTLAHGAPEDLVTMRRYAETAVKLDPSSSDAVTTLALTKDCNWDWYGAEVDYRRALALNPNNSEAHERLGGILDELGRLDEGWKEYQIAQELDPNRDHLADPLYYRGQFDRAIEIRKQIGLRDPGNGYNHYALAILFAQKNMFKEFAVEMGKATTSIGLPDPTRHLQRAYDKAGSQGVLREFAHELEDLAATRRAYFPGMLAEVYAALGDKDRSFYWLEEFRQHYDVATTDPTRGFRINPWFASIRSDPRFSDFLRGAGLPP